MHTGKRMAGGFDPAFFESALDAFTANVAVIDESGEILAVNDAWVQFLDLNDVKAVDHAIGCNYIGFCDRLGTPGGDAVAAGLRALLAGGSGPFRHEYVMPLDAGPRWVKLSAVRVGRLDRPFLIVAHEDISIQRRAELGLREATARLLLAEDAERRRIARELHDSTAQHLAGAKLMLRRLDARDRPARTRSATRCRGCCPTPWTKSAASPTCSIRRPWSIWGWRRRSGSSRPGSRDAPTWR